MYVHIIVCVWIIVCRIVLYGICVENFVCVCTCVLWVKEVEQNIETKNTEP